MTRALRILGFTLLLALPVAGALGQPQVERPVGQVDPGTLTAIYATVTAQAAGIVPSPTPFFDPNATPGAVVATQAPFNPEFTAEPTPLPTATPSISPDALILLDARADLELLADQQLGVSERPPGWSGSSDYADSQLGLLTRADLELLYGGLVDITTRPAGWFGAVGSTPLAVARDVRHDLELMADLFYGPGTRPEGWRSANPLFRCNRATQTLVALLERGGLFVLEVPANDPNFCYNAEVAATTFAETRILASSIESGLFNSALTVVSEYQVSTDFAVAFLDPAATIKVGVIPRGTPIQVIARSYTEFSNMTLVSGPDFQVYVEYQNTTLTADQFRGLPNITGIAPEPTCFAEWCEG